MSDEMKISLAVPKSDDFVAKVEHAYKMFTSTPAKDVMCTMGITVGPNGVHMHIIGDDVEVVKMLNALAHTVREAMEKANNPPDHSNEVKH